MTHGIVYALNGVDVTAPDEETWSNKVIGESLSGTERRSPYRILEWTKRVAGECHLDWFDYDNSTLDSITTRSPGELVNYETYTTAICQSVTFRQRLGVGTEVVARFLVNTG